MKARRITKKLRSTENGVLFTNADSGNDRLYISTLQDTKRWSAILLPKESVYSSSEITLHSAVENNAYFIFADEAPDNPGTFVVKIRTYLPKPQLAVVWLLEMNGIFNDNNVIQLALGTSKKGIEVCSRFSYSIANDTFRFRIAKKTPAYFTPDEAPTYLVLETNSDNSVGSNEANPNISFSQGSVRSKSGIKDNLLIPFTGKSCGALKFQSNLNNFFKDKKLPYKTAKFSDLPECASFEGQLNFSLTPLHKEGVLMQVEINPFDLFNTKGLSTYFAFTGTTTTSTNKTPILTQLDGTINSFPLQSIPFIPKIDWEETIDSNILFPTENAAKIVMYRTTKQLKSTVEMKLAGDFFLNTNQLQLDYLELFIKKRFPNPQLNKQAIHFVPFQEETHAGSTLHFIA